MYSYKPEKNKLFFLQSYSKSDVVKKNLIKENVKQSHYRPGQALRVPGE